MDGPLSHFSYVQKYFKCRWCPPKFHRFSMPDFSVAYLVKAYFPVFPRIRSALWKLLNWWWWHFSKNLIPSETKWKWSQKSFNSRLRYLKKYIIVETSIEMYAVYNVGFDFHYRKWRAKVTWPYNWKTESRLIQKSRGYWLGFLEK